MAGIQPELQPKPRPVRIISGSPALIEGLIAELGTEYAPTHWNFAVVADQLTVTVVMISQSLIRQVQIAQAAGNGGQRRG